MAVHRLVSQLNPGVYNAITERLWLGELGCNSLLFRCPPGPVNSWAQWDVKRLFKCMGNWGWHTTPLFISFTPSPALYSILQREILETLPRWMRWGEQERRRRRVRRRAEGMQYLKFMLFCWINQQKKSHFLILHFLSFIYYVSRRNESINIFHEFIFFFCSDCLMKNGTVGKYSTCIFWSPED